MKKLILISLSIMICNCYALAQSEIISVIPNSGYQGQDLNIMIKGENSHFQQNSTTVDFGAGIKVNHIIVSSNLLLTANVTIDKNISFGDKKLTVTTGTEVIVKEDAFEVLEEGVELNAILSLVPVDVIYLADFDPKNIQSSPLLFTIMITNDMTERDIKVEFILQSEKYGLVGIATKEIKDLKALEVVNFNNREFDEYNVANANQELVTLASQTGLLPSGTYNYILKVYDENGDLIGGDEVDNDFMNEINNIDLVSPGTALDESPQILANQYPYFQWFSNANSFDFAIYEVKPGQRSAENIVTNVPVYEEKGLSSPFYNYPNHAEILQEGKTYAWQIKAYINSSQGEQTLYSDLFWFSYKDQDVKNLQIVSIEVTPDPFDIKVGDVTQFKAFGYDEDDNKTELNCDWSVIPSNGGSIDFDGNFRASDKPRTVAIVASYRGLQAYSTVNVKWFESTAEFEEWNMSRFLRNLFGIN